MRCTFVLMLLAISLIGTVQAQFKRGDVELSFPTAAGWTRAASGSSGAGDAISFLYVSDAPGFYVVDGFSVDVEVGLLAVEESMPVHLFLGGLSYTYLVAGTQTAFFARAGYGISNAVPLPFLGGAPVRVSDNLDVGVLNLGAGVKYLVVPGVALRTEFNYKRSSWSDEYRNYFTGLTTEIEQAISNIECSSDSPSFCSDALLWR